MSIKRPLSLAIGCIVAASGAAQTFAQEADNTTRALEEVVVTAERRAADLQSTPIAVSVFSQKALVENDITDVTDLSGFAPNLVVSGQEEQSDIKIFIRGVGTNNPTETGDQGVGVYVDGVYAARAQGALALMYDLENVQVLRGPQGTLFGRNNTGGAVLLRTKRPGHEFEADMSVTYGSFNRQQISAGFTLPVLDNLSFRIAGISDQDDGWVNAVSTDPRGTEHNFSGIDIGRSANEGQRLNYSDVRSARVTGLWDIRDNLSWVLSYETFTDQGVGGLLLNPVLVKEGKYEAFIDSPVSKDMKSDVFRSTVSFDITDGINMEYIFGGSDLHREQVVDQDAGVISRFQEGRTEYQDSVANSHELKIQNIDSDKLEWTVGAYFFTEETGIRFDFDGQGSWLQGGNSFIQPARGAESAAIYAQAKYKVTDALTLTGGIRYTDDLKYDRGGRNVQDCENEFIRPTLGGSALSVFEDFLDNRTGAEGADGLDDFTGKERVRGQCAATLRNDVEAESTQTTYLARADYEWGDSMVYGSVSTGYRAGVIQDGGQSTDPENSTNYELGYKLDTGAFRWNSAAFFMTYEDLIRSGFDEDLNQIVNSNVAGAEIGGLETEITWRVGQGVFSLAGAYLHAEYTDYIVDSAGFGTNNTPVLDENGGETGFYDLAGNRLPQAPEYSVNASFRWDFDTSLGVITPRINVMYSDEVFFRDQNENRSPINNMINDVEQTGFYYGNPAGQEAYAKVNLGVTFDPGSDWTVDLFINNATDEMTQSSASVDNGTAEGFPGRFSAPRTMGVRFNAQF